MKRLAVNTKKTDQIVDVLGHRVDRTGNDRVVWPMVAATVGDDSVARREAIDLGRPCPMVARRAVDEDDRLATAVFPPLETIAIDGRGLHTSDARPRTNPGLCRSSEMLDRIRDLRMDRPVDALSQALAVVRFHGATFFRLRCGAPWGFSVPPADVLRHAMPGGTDLLLHYHLVTSGRATSRRRRIPSTVLSNMPGRMWGVATKPRCPAALAAFESAVDSSGVRQPSSRPKSTWLWRSRTTPA